MIRSRLTKCVCPRCGSRHKRKMVTAEKGRVMRMYCDHCRRYISRMSPFAPDGVDGYSVRVGESVVRHRGGACV